MLITSLSITHIFIKVNFYEVLFFQNVIFPSGSQSHSLYYTVISQKSTSETKVFNGNFIKDFINLLIKTITQAILCSLVNFGINKINYICSEHEKRSKRVVEKLIKRIAVLKTLP